MSCTLSKTLAFTLASLLLIGDASAVNWRHPLKKANPYLTAKPRRGARALGAAAWSVKTLAKGLQGTARYGSRMWHAYKWSRHSGLKSALRTLSVKDKVITTAVLMALTVGGCQALPPNMSNGYPMYHGKGKPPANARYDGPHWRFGFPQVNGLNAPPLLYKTRGADFKGYPEGHPVVASTRVGFQTKGKVVAVGHGDRSGNYVVLEYTGRWFGIGPKQTYQVKKSHLDSVYHIPRSLHVNRPRRKLHELKRRRLKVGMTVNLGDIVGGEGKTGYAIGSHLDERVKKEVVTKNSHGDTIVTWEPVAPHIDAPSGVERENPWVDVSWTGLFRRLKGLL